LQDRGAALTERDFGKKPFSVEELEQLFGDRPLEPFLNTRHELYRAHDMKRGLPARDELLRMIAETPNLIRRPLLVDGDKILVGFSPGEYDAIVKP
jgi:arsenate reductase-like glutaredoxin family protein